jgi:hypothetical protein
MYRSRASPGWGRGMDKNDRKTDKNDYQAGHICPKINDDF